MHQVPLFFNYCNGIVNNNNRYGGRPNGMRILQLTTVENFENSVICNTYNDLENGNYNRQHRSMDWSEVLWPVLTLRQGRRPTQVRIFCLRHFLELNVLQISIPWYKVVWKRFDAIITLNIIWGTHRIAYTWISTRLINQATDLSGMCQRSW